MDFSSPASMVRTTSPLPLYLYGYDHDWKLDKGRLKITARKVKEHRWAKKRVPSGFFGLPGAENISAVLFSNSGTISKFNRMGVIAGFGSNEIRVFREGTAFDHDPNAAKRIVSSRGNRWRIHGDVGGGHGCVPQPSGAGTVFGFDAAGCRAPPFRDGWADHFGYS